MKVLLIDDHPLIRSALQSVIQGLGDDVTVAGAGSAQEARDTLHADSDFDLLLLDLQLGDANGFDLLVELRAAYPSLPVVVVSASDRTSDVIRAVFDLLKSRCATTCFTAACAAASCARACTSAARASSWRPR